MSPPLSTIYEATKRPNKDFLLKGFLLRERLLVLENPQFNEENQTESTFIQL